MPLLFLMVTFLLVMSKYWIGKGKEQYQITQFTPKLFCTRSAVVTINGAIGGGIVGTVYRYVGSSSQNSQICPGSIARKSFIFIFLLAPEEGLFSNRNIAKGNLFKYIYFCFILLFTSSSPCRKDQSAVSYFSTSLIVLIQVHNWEVRHHSLVCCCELANILYICDS